MAVNTVAQAVRESETLINLERVFENEKSVVSFSFWGARQVGLSMSSGYTGDISLDSLARKILDLVKGRKNLPPQEMGAGEALKKKIIKWYKAADRQLETDKRIPAFIRVFAKIRSALSYLGSCLGIKDSRTLMGCLQFPSA